MIAAPYQQLRVGLMAERGNDPTCAERALYLLARAHRVRLHADALLGDPLAQTFHEVAAKMEAEAQIPVAEEPGPAAQ